jgi:imidazolonepropionase-like amidohydrolase
MHMEREPIITSRLPNAVHAAIAAAIACLPAPPAGTQEATPTPHGIKFVQVGQLLADPSTGWIESRKTIVVSDGQVVEIRNGFVGDGEVIDLRDSFALPGLVDSHVHLLRSSGRQGYAAYSEADWLVDGQVNALTTLRAGFTIVADLNAGYGGDAIYALKDGVAAGKLPGPRIVAVGAMITTHGGHADLRGLREDVRKVLDWGSACSGVDDCRRVTRIQIRNGADLVKFAATGGVTTNVDTGLGQQFLDDEMVAIVEAAHRMDRRVTAHAHGTEGINGALRAGVDAIEHGTGLDDESVRLFKARGAYLVPTLLAGETVHRGADTPGRMRPAVAAKARAAGSTAMDSLRRAHAGGVKIAFGTDAGIAKHGDNAQEFALMVRAGLTPWRRSAPPRSPRPITWACRTRSARSSPAKLPIWLRPKATR